MTLYDLLFLAAALAGIVTLVVACAKRSLIILTKLGAGIVVYVVMVYSATLFSKPITVRPGDPLCNDDWCLAVDNATRTGAQFDLTLRIFSRARRAAMREASAKDVYLVDEHWNRYDPKENATPLNTLLRPGESIETLRHFEVPPSVHITGLKIDYGTNPASLCLVIGECDAFHKGKMLALM